MTDQYKPALASSDIPDSDSAIVASGDEGSSSCRQGPNGVVVPFEVKSMVWVILNFVSIFGVPIFSTTAARAFVFLLALSW